MLESYGLDGTRTLYRAYHALGSDAWDAADLSSGPHAGTPASERKDGHGRTIATVERVHATGGIEERTIRTSYLSTGEVASITRYRGKSPGSDAVVRWMQYDSLGRMVLNVEPNTTAGYVDPGADTSKLKAWRYVYDNAGDLVGTSDARGCGVNYDYDHEGRLVGEDFSPCLKSQPKYTDPADAVEIGSNYEAYYLYDIDAPDAPSTSSGALTTLPDGTPFPHRTGLSLGRLVEVIDRGSETLTSYDGRGRVIAVARRVSKPGDIDPSTSISARYAKSWYVQTAEFDGADRPIAESTGAKVPQLLGNDGSSNIYTSYTKRGSVYQVNSSYGMLVSQLIHDADGLPQSITYGDVAGTRTDYGYDDRLRLKSVQTYRGPPSIWSASTYKPGYGTHAATTFQLLLEDLQYAYDEVDNPTEIHDFRDPTEWPIGSKPVSRKIAYDDLYRVNRVDYQYAAGTDAWVDPYQPETSGTASDTHLAKPSPHVSFDNRILYESFSYDWLGNSVSTDDDAKGFYDRSLGAVTNGTPTAGPYQLKSASNEGTGGTTRKGHLDAKYDDAGNLTDLAVVRSGPCLPSTSNCTQRFHYDWDEAGRMVRARRWDVGGTPSALTPAPLSTPADADLTHAYDAGDMRVRKTATDAHANTSHTLYISAALEIRRATVTSDGSDYIDTQQNEVPQLIAHGVRLGRVSWEPTGAPAWTVPVTGDARPSGQHVFLSLSDHLGSTSTVLDLDTSEVVEKRTSRAYGGVESDQRDPRWEGAKDEKSFTGKEEDEEVGLIYFGARFLSIGLGRWVSADPKTIQAAGADLNAYAYVRGEILRSIDPVGLDEAGHEAPVTGLDTPLSKNEQAFLDARDPLNMSPEQIEGMHAYFHRMDRSLARTFVEVDRAYQRITGKAGPEDISDPNTRAYWMEARLSAITLTARGIGAKVDAARIRYADVGAASEPGMTRVATTDDEVSAHPGRITFGEHCVVSFNGLALTILHEAKHQRDADTKEYFKSEYQLLPNDPDAGKLYARIETLQHRLTLYRAAHERAAREVRAYSEELKYRDQFPMSEGYWAEVRGQVEKYKSAEASLRAAIPSLERELIDTSIRYLKLDK